MAKNKKILIVEDEAVIAMDLQSSLEKFGYEITENISQGEKVFSSIEQTRPDVILMDIKLEGELDGIDTAQIIYEQYDIPIIFITSFSNKNIVERAKRTFPFGYIVKPFEDSELYTNIELAFHKHQAEIKLRESEKKYRELSEAIQQIVLECDKDGAIMYLNPTGMELLGVSPNEISKGFNIKELFLKGQFEKLISGITRSLKEPSSREYKLVTRNGKTLIIEEYLLPVYTNQVLTGFRGVIVDITEREYLHNKVKDSEERFRQIANTIDVAFWIVSLRDNSLHYTNPAVSMIFGIKEDPAKIFLDDLRKMIHPDDRERVNTEYRSLAPSGWFDVSYRIVMPDGSIKWLQERAKPIRNNKGIITRIAGYAADRTEKMAAEFELFESERLKEGILKSMPDSFIQVDRSGIIQNAYIKKSEILLFGGFAEKLIGKTLNSVFPTQIMSVLNSAIQECADNPEVVIKEVNIPKRNKWFEIRVTKGSLNEYLLIIRNITKEKKNINELQKYFNITEQTRELILITDKEGNIEYVNPMFTEVTGYELSDIAGKKPSLFKTKKHPRSFYDELWSTILGGQSFSSEFINFKKNGEEYIEQKIITPIKNEKGEIVNFISTGRDITEERRRERKIRAYQKFEKILEKKEQKYRTLSIIQGEENERKRVAREIHDGLGQMLTVAKANLNAVNSDKIRSNEEKEKITLAKGVMTEIIQELRRISQNLSPGGLYEFGLHAILSQLITKINKNYGGVRIKFESNTEGMRFKNEVEINLYRIVQEGIQNALKHSMAKRINLKINYDQKTLSLVLKDNGIGMNLKKMEDSTKHFNGLRNIQERAKVIDAIIKLNSQPQKGMEIMLSLKTKMNKI
ncbi:MAG: PAS domain S-box protein [Bacteroidia bacterium]